MTFATEIELALDHIDSGCIAEIIDDRTTLIYKCPDHFQDKWDNDKQFDYDFDLILKDEFPSLGFYINVDFGHNAIERIEYFFSLESPDELLALRQLSTQDSFDIVFWMNAQLNYNTITFTPAKKNKLINLLNSINK